LILGQAVKIKEAKGFSLVELVIAIGVLGIVLAIAAPNFNKYNQNTNLQEAARDISSDISLWKQRAVSENISYQIRFDTAANNYTIWNEILDANGLRTGTYAQLVANTKAVGAGYSSIKISGTPSFFPGGVPTITLDPRGTSGNGSVVIINKILSKATITTNPMGRVHVEYSLQ